METQPILRVFQASLVENARVYLTYDGSLIILLLARKSHTLLAIATSPAYFWWRGGSSRFYNKAVRKRARCGDEVCLARIYCG